LSFGEEDFRVARIKCSVLVVDDEPYILSALTAFLKFDYNIISAENGEAAQKVFAERPPDIILSDLKMPRMSGIQLLEWVRKNHPATVRLLMTGYGELDDAVEAINRGQVFRYMFKPWKEDQLLDMLRSAAHTFYLERSHEELLQQLQTMNEQLEKRVADRTRELEAALGELEQKNSMLEKLALTDPLTGLPNRRAMDRLVERELRRRDRYPFDLSLGIIDVDHFKSINDRFLLPGGDKVLIDLAKVLQTAQRNVDLLGRIGGEEFMVLAPETNTEGAIVLGERIRTTVESAAFHYQEQEIPVRVSIGFAVAHGEGPVDYDAMKHAAAQALSEAKHTGRNRVVVHAVGKRPFEQAG
jgi:diguanylate cyclase (GGDEF)-like protein